MPGLTVPRAAEAAARRHRTRAKTELGTIISSAQYLLKRLEDGHTVLQGEAQTLVTASVTVAERLAMLETLSDTAEWWLDEAAAQS